MTALLRQFRRAPGRILASLFALALAVGAIGVLAVPTVSEGTLHEAVDRDGLGDIIVSTTPLSSDQIAAVGEIDGVAAAEGQSILTVELADGSLTQMVGFPDDQRLDLLQLVDGRLPTGDGEIVTSTTVGALGDTVVANGATYTVVGHGTTLWFAEDETTLFASLDTVLAAGSDEGANHLVVLAADDDIDELRAIADEMRSVLAVDGDTFVEFPMFLPDGTTPIDAEIEQISTLIGLLGVAAGLVALVLLASTTNTLVTERTREVAVMRALGGRQRPLRRRLRGIAIGITGAALVVGLPLGIVISNVIARMVLQEFVGVTPDFAVDWWVVAGSTVGALVGARLVAARAARRVTKLPLAEALRDRDGAPFGGRWSQRLATRVPTGGLFGRLATRASVRRPARTLGVITQIAAAVGAAFLIPGLVQSVNEFNTNNHAPWTFESRSYADDVGYPFAVELAEQAPEGTHAEVGIWTWGEIDDWPLDIYGIEADTAFFDADLRSGEWLTAGTREAMLSDGYATRRDIEVGDTVTLELAGGPVEYDIVGTVDDSSVVIYADRDVLATDLGAPGHGNTMWSDAADPGIDLPVAAAVSTADAILEADNAGRDAVVLIFGAIGVVVAGVAGLAVVSSMSVSLFERRHELAALQAIGARRRRLRLLVLRELAVVAVPGIGLGLVLGSLGNRGIIGSFEASNAIEIGVVDPIGTIPLIVAGTGLALALLATVVVRMAAGRPIAETLRGAA
jgi:putative ABC transport system permease protein